MNQKLYVLDCLYKNAQLSIITRFTLKLLLFHWNIIGFTQNTALNIYFNIPWTIYIPLIFLTLRSYIIPKWSLRIYIILKKTTLGSSFLWHTYILFLNLFKSRHRTNLNCIQLCIFCGDVLYLTTEWNIERKYSNVFLIRC